MSNRREFKPISVVTKSYKFLLHKIYKLSNNTKEELEAFAFSVIAFRYPSNKNQKLKELLQNRGILLLKKGDLESKKYQLLMDNSLKKLLFTNPVGVITHPGY